MTEIVIGVLITVLAGVTAGVALGPAVLRRLLARLIPRTDPQHFSCRILHLEEDTGKLLHVDIEDCTLMGYKVFGSGGRQFGGGPRPDGGPISYTTKGKVRAYVHYRQPVPEFAPASLASAAYQDLWKEIYEVLLDDPK